MTYPVLEAREERPGLWWWDLRPVTSQSSPYGGQHYYHHQHYGVTAMEEFTASHQAVELVDEGRDKVAGQCFSY